MANLYGADSDVDSRDGWQAAKRGLMRCCPACGEGRLFSGWLTPAKECNHCGLAIDNYRADDGPAYMSIFLVGHILVPLMLILEQRAAPEPWVHAVLWGPLAVILSLVSLPLFKGLLIGWQWAKDMKSDERF